MSIFTLAFFKASAERALKSAVQGAVTAGIGAAGFDAVHADWQTIGGAALSMAILSLAFSVLSGLGTGDGPSLTNSEELPVPNPPAEPTDPDEPHPVERPFDGGH
jgi:hypothetical protein